MIIDRLTKDERMQLRIAYMWLSHVFLFSRANLEKLFELFGTPLECVDALYTLEHRLHVKLPESSYYKYTTVGGVVKDIVRQLKVRSK